MQEQIDRQIALLDDRGEASPTPDSGTAGAASAELDDKSHRLRIARRVGQLIGQLLSQVALEPTAEAEAGACSRRCCPARTGTCCGRG